MTINAYEKIKKVLMDACCDFQYETYDLLDEENIKAKQWLLESGYGTKITDFRKKYPDTKVLAKEYSFENGLAFFYIKYLFTNNKGNSCIQREFALMDECKKMVHVIFRSKRKSYLNVLEDKDTGNTLCPLGEKVIEIRKVEVSVDKSCSSCFTSYHNLTDCTLLQEVYSQGGAILEESDVSNPSLASSDFLDNNDQFIIKYKKQKPISVQLNGDFCLEDLGYDPDSEEDALEFVQIIQKELDTVIRKIESSIGEYVKKHKSAQKTIGTN